MTRMELIHAIQTDDPNRPACAMYLDGYLISVQGSRRSDDVYDIYVFEESFRGDSLQPWQVEMLDAPHVECLGCRNPRRLYYTYAVSYTVPLTKDIVAALRKRFTRE